MGQVSGGLSVNDRFFAPLVAMLLASGCAALIYQVVWFQLLGLVIGASAPSAGVLLGTFMGGLCVGGLVLPRWIGPERNPLEVFAALEAGIAACGLAVLHVLPGIEAAYVGLADADRASIAVRALVAALCLVPPTVLMGATLPIVARCVRANVAGWSRVGWLYSANTAGGVLGSVCAGFYLLRVHDAAVATYAAAALNIAAALAALAVAVVASRSRAPEAGVPRIAEPPADRLDVRGSADAVTAAGGARTGSAWSPSAHGVWAIHATAALSGMTALAAEVLWTRHLALLFGPTVYAFALILAVFLLGLGAGSGAGALAARRTRPAAALAACQWLLCAAIGWAAFAIARSLPYWPLDVTLPSSPTVLLQADLLRAAWAILPAALLWGASFPLALAAAGAHGGAEPGVLTGRVYAANTLGAIVGSLLTSLVLVVVIGGRATQQTMIAASACAALLALAPLVRRTRLVAAALFATAVVVSAAALVRLVPEMPPEVVAYGRFTPTRGIGADVIHTAEGWTGAFAVTREPDGMLTYHGAGKAQASTYPQDMRLQRMLGHLATLVADEPKRVLVIGLGAGVTAGAVSIDPATERVVVAEIEPRVREIAASYFRAQNHGVVGDPKVELRFDDGRHYLATAVDRFDVITSDPLDPWVKGAATLYTREFWQLVRSRLAPGGVVTVFVQLYESTEDAVRSEIATFFDAFPNGAVFANTVRGAGYDVVLLARAGDAPIDVDLVAARLARPEYARVAASLREVGFRSAADLLGTYAGGRDDLAHWLDGAEINTDRNLRLQYLAGEGLNRYDANEIFERMLPRGAAFPDRLFTGSPAALDGVRRAIARR
jgi:spermidine synthase